MGIGSRRRSPLSLTFILNWVVCYARVVQALDVGLIDAATKTRFRVGDAALDGGVDVDPALDAGVRGLQDALVLGATNAGAVAGPGQDAQSALSPEVDGGPNRC